MIEKTLTISGIEVKFKASAAVPRMYRARFGRDILVDFQSLESAYAENADKDASNISVLNLEIFEDIAYIMALHADPNIPESIDEWLEQFEMFSIYDIMPEIIKLWNRNQHSESKAKKNGQQQSEK